ncbi:MAG: hypothetical protein U9Q33_01165 [Campylobacterota bacterium]|nr:hypothetical protein [Campylobacterota bacterium]
MELLPKELEDTLPKLYDTEDILTDKKILHIRFIAIFSNWEWYLCEYDNNTKRAFGYVKGHEAEWGYFSLTEFQEINDENLKIIRDENFKPGA